MNIIDQVVSWFSPQQGLRRCLRQVSRQAWRDALRHYDAGDDSRLNANWRAVNASAEQTDRYSRDTVRARARDLERNSDMLGGVIGAFVRNVAGGGIEYTPYNKPVGYWFRQYSIDGITSPEPVCVDAKDVIFYFSKRRPSQLREMSDMSQTLTRIRDANEFMVAEDTKQRILACVALFIKKINPNLGRGRTGTNGKGYDRRMFTPGMVNELEAGDEVDMINPQGQATDAAAYVKLLQRLVSSGQGVSYEAVARDMSGSTYSSTRQNLIEDGMTYADEVELLVEVIDEIYESFLISAVLAGKLSMPDFWNQKEAYFTHKWVKPPKP
ncbi:phage portal protein [Acutalibacter sp. 1XD8-33]|uniref:phage portal protein n=1 Tax=Acutalibacter sp. 1XD8-33 TaxID=2320081 RepID=UPI001FA956E3|nr:phage portal protein [Acutalibacter sp. 1XD8-33]